MLSASKWITSPKNETDAVHIFEKNFTASGKIKQASLYVTSMGVYNAYINGCKVGKNVLAPGFTSYKLRILYQTYDVTELISKENTLAIGVGKGWAVNGYGSGNSTKYYAYHTSLIACLNIEYENGTSESLVTDENFDVYTSKTLFSDIYNGETIDLTAPKEYLGKAVTDKIDSALVAQDGEWIYEQERIYPIEFIKTPRGELVIDFGQNMTGYVEVKASGKRGEKILIHHAEVLDRDGNFYTKNYRTAKNEMTYILSGGDDVFKPEYTFQGFRYIRLTEYPFDTVDLSSFTAIAVHSDMKRTADFTTGNEKINQLYHNIVWGQKSNFLDVPTDCPQRDERLGWTGDAQVFCRTASINYNTEKFFTKWLADLALDQELLGGAVDGVVPKVFKNTMRISAAWGDAATVVPWEIYTAYGNKELLKKHFSIMKKWVDYLHGAGPEEYLWLGGHHFGDWLAMDADEDSYFGATSTDLIASAFFAYSTELLIKAGEALDYDMSEYKVLHKNIKSAFREYFTENGIPKEKLPRTEADDHNPVDREGRGITQTSLSLILKFGLCEESERERLAEKLCELIKENDGKMTTGFVGTPYIMHALSENGKCDLAYSLLFEERTPSWLYSVTHGATTMWEHWNSLKEDGSFWSKDMNSFNHYAYGAVFDWLFNVSLGICPSEEEAGYKKVYLRPHPNKNLGFAKGHIETRFGKISAHWYYKGDKVFYEYEIPEEVTAELTLPSGKNITIGSGNYRFAE